MTTTLKRGFQIIRMWNRTGRINDLRRTPEPPQWTLEAARAIFNDRRMYESNEAMIQGHAALIAKAQSEVSP